MSDSTRYLKSELLWRSATGGDNYYMITMEGGPLDGATITVNDPAPAKHRHALLMRPLWVLGRPDDGWPEYSERYRLDLITRTATWERAADV
jgi:hypothetical protein